MTEIERRAADGEIRVEGRKLHGTAMRFGDVSPTHRERFEPGAFRYADTVHLDLDHDPERAIAWTNGGGLDLSADDAELRIAVEAVPPIPAGNRALEEIRAGKNGLSVEFRALKERRDADGIRVIEEAELRGVGIVGRPSYEASRVEARSRKHGRFARWL